MSNPFQYVSEYQPAAMTAAKEAIQKSYLKLSQTKGYENISVKALCEAAHVSRSTFYVYYRRDI